MFSIFIITNERYVHQAAQDVTRRTIRDERSRASRLGKETQNTFEEREKEAVVRLEQAEESWKAER